MFSLIQINSEAGEAAQWLRTLVALAKDPGSIPSTPMVAQP